MYSAKPAKLDDKDGNWTAVGVELLNDLLQYTNNALNMNAGTVGKHFACVGLAS